MDAKERRSAILQLLRNHTYPLTGGELAKRMGVSRQTVSKWELDAAQPGIDKLVELCGLFSCSMDQLVLEEMGAWSDAYSDIRMQWEGPFRFLRYAVVSMEPEDDAKAHVMRWAQRLGLDNPKIIGWDFPVVSQEQINVHKMHGYAAALILDEGTDAGEGEVLLQKRQRYLTIAIRDPFSAPFRLIPNAYRALDAWMAANGVSHTEDTAIPCFEREYEAGGVEYMDVSIAVE